MNHERARDDGLFAYLGSDTHAITFVARELPS